MLPTARDFAERPRESLMWPPRARDVSRIAAAARALSPAPSVLDAGAGSGLLARLLADGGLRVVALDAVDGDAPARGVGRHFPVERRAVTTTDGPFDLAILSWMEPGRDYREVVARVARAVVEARDPAGGIGRGVTGFAEWGLGVAASWTTPSHEDVAHAMRTRGRGPGGVGLPRPGGWGNLVEVWTRADDADAIRAAVEAAPAPAPYPWEPELVRWGLVPPDGPGL